MTRGLVAGVDQRRHDPPPGSADATCVIDIAALRRATHERHAGPPRLHAAPAPTPWPAPAPSPALPLRVSASVSEGESGGLLQWLAPVVARRRVELAALGSFAASLLVGAWLLWPAGTDLRVEVVGGSHATRVAVHVDGIKRCDVTPCIVPDVDDGFHAIQVTSPGYDAYPSALTSDARGARVVIVRLEPAACGSQAAAARPAPVRAELAP
jgi:hypothetical protein